MIAQQTPSNPFQAALAAKAAAIQAQFVASKPAPKPATEEQALDVRLTVDIVANKNRIDLFFSGKPSDSILAKLRDRCWHFRPSDKAWYHQDNDKNRAWLIEEFDAPIELDEDSDLDHILTDDEIKAAYLKNAPTLEAEIVEEPEEKPEYHRIVDALCAYYNESPADVCIRAVRLLHSETMIDE